MQKSLYEFRILGEVEVYRCGRRIALGRRRERILLGLLLLEAGRAVPVDRLITLLWEGEPPANPKASLHTHISRLRTQLALGDEPEGGVRLVAQHSGYLADLGPEAVDAHRFTRLVGRARQLTDAAQRARELDRALALWRGPLLADVASDRLRERVGGHLTELRLAVLTERIDAQLACGQHKRLIGELSTLAAEQPDREDFTARLMLALYRSGRQHDAMLAYQRLRERLADVLGADPAPEMRELYHAIVRQDPDLANGLSTWPGAVTASATARAATAVPDAAGPVDDGPADGASGAGGSGDGGLDAGRPPVLRQLPANRGEFVGREPELEIPRKAVRQALGGAERINRILIFTIEGMAGVGKTRLAVQLAHEMVAEGLYPDGQLYVDLRGFTPDQEPADPSTVLEAFLRQLGVERTEIPSGLPGRAAMFRDRLAGRRVLVLLDNAAGENQVQPLLPANPGNLILITSRRTLALDGAQPITLETFSPPEALRLFATIVGDERVAAEPQAAEELVARCGYLPLAITLAAHRLRARPAWRLADLTLRMEDERRRLAELSARDRAVEAVFALSYRVLEPDQRRLFRRLALHPGTEFTRHAAAVLAQTTLQHAETLLDRLLAEHLLMETTPGRYRFHDLVRAYASRCAHTDEPAAERSQVLLRLLRWYLAAADTADRVLDPVRRRVAPTAADNAGVEIDFDGPGSAMAWFEAERSNLVAVVETAGATGADALAWQLSAAMLTFLYIRSHFTEWLAVHRVALISARRVRDRPAEAGVLNRLGVLHSAMQRSYDSIGYHRQALAIRRDLDDRTGQAWTLNNLGVVHSELGAYREALDCFRTAVTLFRESADSRGEGIGLANLADTHRRLGETAQAAECLRQALSVQDAAGDRSGRRHTHTFLGDLHQDLGESEDAVREYRNALDIYQELGDRRGAATVLASLGRSLHVAGQVEAARQCWSDALAGYIEIGDPRAAEMRRALHEIGG